MAAINEHICYHTATGINAGFNHAGGQAATVECAQILQQNVAFEIPAIGFDNIGGVKEQLTQIKKMVVLSLKQPQVLKIMNVQPPLYILLHGPPGTGKTSIARAVAKETDVSFCLIHGPEIMSGLNGEPAFELHKAFEEAKKKARAIIFIDKLDVIAPKHEKSHGKSEHRIVLQLLTLLDDLQQRSNVIIMAATNRPNSFNPVLRRFHLVIDIGIPNAVEREEILRIHTQNIKLGADVDLEQIANETHGYVGADLVSLCSKAALQQIREKMDVMDFQQYETDVELRNELVVTKENFRYALNQSKPSALHEMVVEKPRTTWEDIHGLNNIKRELRQRIEYNDVNPYKFVKFDKTLLSGILLYGPPGCGKTILAKAMANECGANFILVKVRELSHIWFEESEANVRDVFDKACQAAPCVLFLHGLDCIAKSRGGSIIDSGIAADRVFNQFLIEMDSMRTKNDVFIIGATTKNIIDIDASIFEPGRLDYTINVPLPDDDAHKAILQHVLKQRLVNEDDIPCSLRDETKEFGGAILIKICELTYELAVKESIKRGILPQIFQSHFEEAIRFFKCLKKSTDIVNPLPLGGSLLTHS
ncbi:unnamed protein product [Adineta steineri]|uniref:AAA+ ATPase domain-containing protein n=1 Tax=Adineta steineri TaxID=433720 RepID=A0A819NAF4_9BILA|nr:unnamed protein product [Adineta steineri]CAF3990650.1 unnamed protein product [Adineta steineri]